MGLQIGAAKQKPPVTATSPVETGKLAYLEDKKDKKGQTQTGFVANVPMSPGYSPAINPAGVGGTFDSAKLS